MFRNKKKKCIIGPSLNKRSVLRRSMQYAFTRLYTWRFTFCWVTDSTLQLLSSLEDKYGNSKPRWKWTAENRRGTISLRRITSWSIRPVEM